MEGKRSFTVPVLLLIITVMAVLLVLAYSKLLLTQQAQRADEGRMLARQYKQAALFAAKLKEGADLMLRDDALQTRLQAKTRFGEAAGAAGETAELLAEASSRTSGQSAEAALRPIAEAANAIVGASGGVLYGFAEHEGPLTADEKRVLEQVREEAGRMSRALAAFYVPSGDAAYRNMEAGVGWIDPARNAGEALTDLAAKLRRKP